MIPIPIHKGDSFYFSSSKGDIFIFLELIYRPDGTTPKTYKSVLEGRLYPIYISARTMQNAIIIKPKPLQSQSQPLDL